MHTRTYRFYKSLRLLDKHSFNFVFDKANRLSSRYITLLYRPNEGQSARIGFVVSKKSLPKANQRNTFKRIVRESFRHNQYELPNVDIVILSKKNLKMFERDELSKQIEKLWQKLS